MDRGATKGQVRVALIVMWLLAVLCLITLSEVFRDLYSLVEYDTARRSR